MPVPPSLSAPDIATLRSQLDGGVSLPGDTDYDELRSPWLQVVDQHPALIVDAASAADVVSAVNVARMHGLPLAVMATGHGIAAPCDDGLLLRLAKMKQITVDPAEKIARLGPGVLSGELLAATEPHGLVFAAGQVSNVGVTGYTLGGGMGWLVRALGVASDAVLEATVVLADGSVVQANADTNPDVFWALRGGGGNFGVVVSLEMALAPIPEISGGELWYPLEQAADVLRFYRAWSADLSNQTSTILRLVAVPPTNGSPPELAGKTGSMIGLCCAEPERADAVVDSLASFGPPILNTVHRQPLSGLAALDMASRSPGSPTYGHVEYLRELSDAVIDGLVRMAETRMPPLMQIEIRQLGGALRERDVARGAFLPSAAPYLLHTVTPAIEAPMAEIADATQQAFAELGDVYTGEADYNFLRGDEEMRVPRAFSAATYERLREIKRRYDPTNVFHFNLNIEPASADPA